MAQIFKILSGINIQYPISRMIIDGKKTIETRTYAIPPHYIKKEMFIIETPGRTGKFKARIIGTITFGESFKYKSKRSFYEDYDEHCVDPSSAWAWKDEKGKWGWPILKLTTLNSPIEINCKIGIKYTKTIKIKI